jgi:hypothetical protein
MNIDTIRSWALKDGISPRTVTRIRGKLNVGKKVGQSFLVTKEEWEQIKSAVKYFHKKSA